MKTIRQSTLAVLIAVVSTAAFGPGTFFSASPDAALRQAKRGIMHAPASLPELEAGMRLALSSQPAPAAMPAGLDLEDVDFLAVDLASLPANAAHFAGGPGWFTGAAADKGLPAGAGPGLAGMGSGSARSAGQSVQSGRSGSLPASAGGPVSGFSADPAAAGPSAIALDDPALADHGIAQLPLLALAPSRGDIDAGRQGGEPGGGAAGAVPEPATLLLLGPGLLGLLAARRCRRAARAASAG